MKKICIALVIVFVLTVSIRPARALVGYAVVAIVGASLIIAGASVLIPAFIKANESRKERWASLALSVSNATSFVASASIAAVAAESSILKSAMSGFVGPSKGETVFNGSTVGYNVINHTDPTGVDLSSLNLDTSLGWFSNCSTLAYNAVAGYGQVGGFIQGGYQFYYNLYNTHPNRYYAFCQLSNPGTTNTFTAYTSANLGAELSTGAAAGDQAALNVLRAGWSELNENMAGRSNSLSPTLVAAGKTILNNAVTQAQADAVDGETAKTPEEIATAAGTAALTEAQIKAAMIAALSNQGLSNAQILSAVSAALALNPGLTGEQVQAAMTAAMAGVGVGLTQEQTQAAVEAALQAKGLTATGVASAVKTAIDDATGVEEPTETTTIIPEKLSLTGIMTAFITSLNNMPILATLRGLTINVSGSSTLCLNLPENLGGNRCWDAGGMSDGLNMIGTAFLSLTTLFSFVSIFRG